MSHKEVYGIFESLMPFYAERTIEWWPNGKNSIRIRQKDYQEFIFTYNNINDWLFETVDHFLDRLKGVSKMKC